MISLSQATFSGSFYSNSSKTTFRDIMGTSCSVSFKMMGPETAAGNTFLMIKRASGSHDHYKKTPQAM